MPVNIDFVPFLVNYAGDYAVGTTYMALTQTNITFAGVSAVPLYERHLFQFSRQEHSCSALCSSPGICQIDTTPQSIEATFTGRHETFQYTKVCSSLLMSWANVLITYSVYARYVSRDSALLSSDYFDIVAKRLRCVKIIEPGEVGHLGPHIHNNEKRPFHFCESR
jgi:hypothetical protein